MYSKIPKADIRLALEKILENKGFKRSPLLSRFLRFVVENTIDGNINQIKEYTVAIKVLGKPNTFNPQLDASVRIHAIRLRNMLSEYYQEHKDESLLRIELPKGRYIPIFSHNGHNHEIKPAITLDNLEREDTICIMPFNGMEQQPSLDFSITGFCEYLSEKLSQFEDIKVISFHSALQFTSQGGRMEDVGTSLGVSYFLTGSIEVESEALLISFHLFDAQNNIIIWSQNTSASLLHTGVVEAANTISNRIVASLAGYSGFLHYRKVLDKNKVPSLNNKMANAIFWFYNYQVYRSEELFYAAIKRLNEVVKVDEDCALCWAVLAHLYADAMVYNFKTDINPLEAALASVDKAFALDPNCQHAHLANAWIHIIMRNKNEAITSIEKSYNVNPNSSSSNAMSSLGMAFLGEYSKSLAYLEKAKQLNPLPNWWMNLPELFVALKKQDFEKVLFFARKSTTPRVIYEHIFEMIGLYYIGDFETLRKVSHEYKTKYPDGLVFVEQALSTVLMDDELVDLISKALQAIGKIEYATGNH